MESFLLLFVIVFMGFLVKFPKEKRFNFLKSFVIVYAEVIMTSILFVGLLFGIMKTPLRNYMLNTPNSLFVVVLLIAIIDGIIISWFNRWLIPKFNVTLQVQTLCEYIIQWSLIYITVYQVIFDNIVKSAKLLKSPEATLANMDILNPADMMMIILPSLISVWIGVIVYKAYKDTI